MRSSHGLLSSLLVLVGACGDESPARFAPECNPLGFRMERWEGSGVATSQCAMPYPSSIYEAPDDASPTGVRLDIPTDALPIASHAEGPKPVDTSLWTRFSGFPASTRILVEMPGGFDDSNIAFHTDIDASLANDHPVLLVDMASGARVPLWAEADRRHPDPEKRVLFIHPADRLRGGARYAVGLTREVRAADGSPHERPEAFARALDGRSTGHVRYDRVDHEATLAALEGAGVSRDDLLLAWDFTTAADSDYLGQMVEVRDLALDAVGSDGVGYEITLVDDTPVQETYRRTIEGRITVPWFLTSTDLAFREGFLGRDLDGRPALGGEATAVFKLGFPSNPECYAGGADMPVLLYGHGLFGDYHAIDYDDVDLVANEACVIPATTNWVGWDEATRVGAIEALFDVSIAHLPMERIMQALVNFMALGRTATGLLRTDPAAQVDGVQVIRPGPETVLYYGNSQGGIFGTTLMAYHPDVARGVLGVPGGIYSLMLPRSVDWPTYELMLAASYPDLADQRLLLTMFQSAFDITDPASVAPYLLADPDALGVPEKRILLLEALGDSQVPNLATENMARTMGVPLLHGSAVRPWGFDDVVDGVPSALVVYEVEGAEMPPETTDFDGVEDNGTHGYVREHPTAIRQMAEFLTGDGLVHDFCDPEEGCVLRD